MTNWANPEPLGGYTLKKIISHKSTDTFPKSTSGNRSRIEDHIIAILKVIVLIKTLS